MNRYKQVFLVALVLGVLLEFVASPHHPHHRWWNDVPLFWVLFGFAGCAVIVVASKFLGRIGLQRKEGYYD